MVDPVAIVKEISRWRYPLNSEKKTQAHIYASLQHGGFSPEREVNLGDGDIVDFFCDGVALEVKLKGQRREILRQCERYAAHEQVQSLILATNAAMGFPKEIAGKPCYMVSLGMAWL